MDESLRGRVVVVTGGGNGIGRAYCEGFARAGARVVVAELDGAAGEATAASIRNEGGEAVAVQTDVAEESSTQAMAGVAQDAFGRVDVLVNNAAVFATIPISRVPLEEVPLDEWDLVLRVNLRGIFLATRAVLPGMKERRFGRIINISSSTVFEGLATRIHYVTSKAGVIGFTRTLAREVGPFGITVNALAPGSTLSEQAPDERITQMRSSAAERRAIPRVQVPADVVGTVLYLASDASSFMTGQTLVVDGGSAMH